MSNLLKGWKETVLSEIIDTKIDNRGRNPERYSDFGIPVIDNYLITGNRHIDLDSIRRYVDQEIYENFIRNYLNENDVLITLVGNGYGNVSLAPSRTCVIIQNTIGLRCDNSNDNIFLYYYLKNSKKKLELMDIGAAQPSIKVGTLLDMKLIIPESLDEQNAIASILSSLDKKIELLKEQNKTLEMMAQTIFKEWFVNFNYPDATGEMVESEMGQIPKGWRVGRLGNEFDITIGRTPPRQESHWFSETPQGMKWASIKDMGNAGVYIFKTSEYIVDEAVEKFNIPIIPKNTTILSFKMTVGKVSITTEDMLSNEAIAHMKIKNGSFLTSEYIYLFLLNLNFNSLGSTSSIVMAINTAIIKQIKFFIPDEITMKDFNQLVAPIFKKIKHNSEQIQSIEETRDLLLPRLMSGKLRVDEYDV